MVRKERAKKLRRVVSWRTSSVNSVKKKEGQWPTACKIWESIQEQECEFWE